MMKKTSLLLFLCALIVLSGCGGSGGNGNNNPVSGAPDNITLTTGPNQITVTWDAVAGATAYEVWYHTTNNSGAAQQFVGDGNPADTICVITGLIDGTTYYVWVKAKNNNGTSSFSPPQQAEPQPSVTAPAAPGIPAVTTGIRQLTVTWTPVAGATAYEVWYHTANNSGEAHQFGSDITDLTCTITGLTNGTTYYAWIKAKNNIGTSDFSPPAQISLPTLPAAPGTPTVSAGNRQLTVTWTPVAGATAYEVWYHTANNSDAANRFTGDGNPADTACIITGLTNGTTYYVWVKAVNSAGASNFSPVANGQPVGGPATGAIIIDHTCTDLTRIPQTAIQNAKNNLIIAYGHTSHGSQLINGMSGLVGFINGGGLGLSYPNNFFAWNNGGTGGALQLRDFYNSFGGVSGANDLGAGNWHTATDTYLAAHPEVNVIIWSWCGQADTDGPGRITTYLSRMTALETKYPNVKFVYMTGHLAGSGTNGNLNKRNDEIRNYCRTNQKILYDFADIESYGPDGATNYMALNANDNCDYDPSGGINRTRNWAEDWQSAHTKGTYWYECYSAHSKPLNANRKAYAAWWLWARLAGWDGN